MKLTGVPLHVNPPLLYIGVTERVETTRDDPVLVAVNVPMFPVPLAPNPIVVFEFVHRYPVPVPVKVIDPAGLPLHTTCELTLLAAGVGFTVMVKLSGVPVQPTPEPVYVGLTVIVAVDGIVPVLTAVKDPILPVPLPVSPIEVFEFVHVYTVPGTLPLKVIAPVLAPLHTTWLETVFTTGLGFTVMVKLTVDPEQLVPELLDEGVTLMVATTGDEPVLVDVKVPMFPVPLPARPIEGCVLVQLYVVPVPVKVTAAVGPPLHNTWLLTGLTTGSSVTVVV